MPCLFHSWIVWMLTPSLFANCSNFSRSFGDDILLFPFQSARGILCLALDFSFRILYTIFKYIISGTLPPFLVSEPPFQFLNFATQDQILPVYTTLTVGEPRCLLQVPSLVKAGLITNHVTKIIFWHSTFC